MNEPVDTALPPVESMTLEEVRAELRRVTGTPVKADVELLRRQALWQRIDASVRVKRLRDLVFANTATGSRHQDEALKLLDAHLGRGFVPEIKWISCGGCGCSIECVRWTENGNIVDSWGYVEEVDKTKTVCHNCLGEGYIGDIFLPGKTGHH